MENENTNTQTTGENVHLESTRKPRNYYIMGDNGNRVVDNLKDQKECINWIKEYGSIDALYGIYYSVFVENKIKSTRIVMK